MLWAQAVGPAHFGKQNKHLQLCLDELGGCVVDRNFECCCFNIPSLIVFDLGFCEVLAAG